MVVKLEKTTIGGTQWAINTLPTSDGLTAFTQLGAIVGAPAGTLAGGISKETSLANLDSGLVGDALAKMTLRLADPSTVQLVQLLLKDLTKANGKGGFAPIDFELEFAANYGTLLQLITWSIKINFASFFDGNPVLGALLEKVKQSTRGISTGDSGES